jgi:hypothetical protein
MLMNSSSQQFVIVSTIVLVFIVFVIVEFSAPSAAPQSVEAQQQRLLCQLLNSSDYTKGNWTTRSYNDSLQCAAVVASQTGGGDVRTSERLCLGGKHALPWLQWTPRKCDMPSDQELHKLLSNGDAASERPFRVQFVGDSIVNQLQLNLQCQLEVAALYRRHNWQTGYLSAPFLFKPDLKAQFWTKHLAGDSVARLSQMLLMQANWTEWLSAADVVLINTGVWWSAFKMMEMFHRQVDVEQLNRLFESAIIRTLNRVRAEKAARTVVLFLATLPMHSNCKNDNVTSHADYNWNLIASRNDYVRDAIANASIDGLHFVDLQRMLAKRADAHPGAAVPDRSHDCGHWCNLFNSPLNDAVRLLQLAIHQSLRR